MNFPQILRDDGGPRGAPPEKIWGDLISGVLPPGPKKKKVWDVAAAKPEVAGDRFLFYAVAPQIPYGQFRTQGVGGKNAPRGIFEKFGGYQNGGAYIRESAY